MKASETVRNGNPGVIAPPPLAFLSFHLTGHVADRFLLGLTINTPEALRCMLGSTQAVYPAAAGL